MSYDGPVDGVGRVYRWCADGDELKENLSWVMGERDPRAFWTSRLGQE